MRGFALPPEDERIYLVPELAMSTTTGSTSVRPVSFAAPFRQTAFAVICTATLVSNVGGWMYSAASGWLMTSRRRVFPVRQRVLGLSASI
jgi:hypothetical protein